MKGVFSDRIVVRHFESVRKSLLPTHSFELDPGQQTTVFVKEGQVKRAWTVSESFSFSVEPKTAMKALRQAKDDIAKDYEMGHLAAAKEKSWEVLSSLPELLQALYERGRVEELHKAFNAITASGRPYVPLDKPKIVASIIEDVKKGRLEAIATFASLLQPSPEQALTIESGGAVGLYPPLKRYQTLRDLEGYAEVNLRLAQIYAEGRLHRFSGENRRPLSIIPEERFRRIEDLSWGEPRILDMLSHLYVDSSEVSQKVKEEGFARLEIEERKRGVTFSGLTRMYIAQLSGTPGLSDVLFERAMKGDHLAFQSFILICATEPFSFGLSQKINALKELNPKKWAEINIQLLTAKFFPVGTEFPLGERFELALSLLEKFGEEGSGPLMDYFLHSDFLERFSREDQEKYLERIAHFGLPPDYKLPHKGQIQNTLAWIRGYSGNAYGLFQIMSVTENEVWPIVKTLLTLQELSKIIK
jgi:hypothetical protein